jgi:sensor histidine kinase YesM
LQYEGKQLGLHKETKQRFSFIAWCLRALVAKTNTKKQSNGFELIVIKTFPQKDRQTYYKENLLYLALVRFFLGSPTVFSMLFASFSLSGNSTFSERWFSFLLILTIGVLFLFMSLIVITIQRYNYFLLIKNAL